jgi:hypothetical protein
MLINLDLEQIYEFVAGDEEGELCDEIPEEACSDIPRNFFINAGNGMATKLADQLANPGLVLPWFLDALGAPASVTGFLTPVRRAGALLPQLIVAGQIRQFPIRKWFWIAGGFLFGLFLILMVPTAYFLPGLTAGIVIVVLLGLGSLSRGVSSVAFKDVLAKTIPKGRRGILLATRATVGGVLALGAGLILRLKIQNQNDSTPFLLLIGLAGMLWILGVTLVPWISEAEGATEGSRNPIQEARAGLKLLRAVPGFRKFVVSRGVLLTIELSLPFYALFAHRSTGGGASDLGVFVIAASASQVLSSPLWGRLADQSSRMVMILSSGLAASAGILAIILGNLPGLSTIAIALAIPVLMLGFAIAGVRLGRKTYLVDDSPEIQRPLYVAVSNTITGGLILLGSGFGFIADYYGIQILILITGSSGIISPFGLLPTTRSQRYEHFEGLYILTRKCISICTCYLYLDTYTSSPDSDIVYKKEVGV